MFNINGDNFSEMSTLSAMMVSCAYTALDDNRLSDALNYISAVAESDQNAQVQRHLAYVVFGVIRALQTVQVPDYFHARFDSIEAARLDIQRTISLPARLDLLRYCLALEKRLFRNFFPTAKRPERIAAIRASESIVLEFAQIFASEPTRSVAGVAPTAERYFIRDSAGGAINETAAASVRRSPALRATPGLVLFGLQLTGGTYPNSLNILASIFTLGALFSFVAWILGVGYSSTSLTVMLLGFLFTGIVARKLRNYGDEDSLSGDGLT